MKRVLLAAMGLTPQVITETIYALIQQGRMIDELQVLTTKVGKELCVSSLLCQADNPLDLLLDEYGIPRSSLHFDANNIHAVEDECGRVLEDIQTEDDNIAYLQACMKAAYRLSRDPGQTVYYSIAGGRKTMGAAMALAAQCYGRPQDRLFHVLVSEEFESCGNFFFPPRESRPVELKDVRGEPYVKESKYARIQLVSLPFFSLREYLGETMMHGPELPEALMLSLVREDEKRLSVDVEQGIVAYGGREVDLPPSHMALYSYFVQRQKDRGADAGADVHEVLADQHTISALYRAASRRSPSASGLSDTGILNLNQENFNAYKTKINTRLERAFGPYESPLLKINSSGRKPVRYGLDMKPDRIRLIR